MGIFNMLIQQFISLKKTVSLTKETKAVMQTVSDTDFFKPEDQQPLGEIEFQEALQELGKGDIASALLKIKRTGFPGLYLLLERIGTMSLITPEGEFQEYTFHFLKRRIKMVEESPPEPEEEIDFSIVPRIHGLRKKVIAIKKATDLHNRICGRHWPPL